MLEMRNMLSASLIMFACVFRFSAPECAAEETNEIAPPKVGDEAPDFQLNSVSGDGVMLAETLEEGRVVLLVLRGYPGYQCPLCTRQVADFISQAKKFADREAQILMVYPGPAEELEERAQEFLEDVKLPKHFQLLLDPDYEFTELYHLRWNAPKETAYPSTFIIGQDGKVKFAKVSKSHGGRTSAKQVLAQLAK